MKRKNEVRGRGGSANVAWVGGAEQLEPAVGPARSNRHGECQTPLDTAGVARFAWTGRSRGGVQQLSAWD